VNNHRLASFFSIPWYPFVLAAYPVLTLLSANIQQVEISAALRPLVISLAGSIFLFLLLRLLMRDWRRAAFSSTVLIILFFAYGHVYNALKTASVLGFALGRHRLLLFVWLLLVVLGILAGASKHISLHEQSASFNVMALVLVAFPFYVILMHVFLERRVAVQRDEPLQSLVVSAGQDLPDVYYIILDSYTRSDVLKNTYNYDNSEFLENLREMGFYVADCSASNYMWTRLSVSSALNMQYLQDIPAYAAADDKDVISEELLKHSLLRRTLESAGYRMVAFATGFPFNEVTDADVYLEPPSLMENTREFEALVMQTTLLRVLQDFGLIYINQTVTARYRDRTLFALAEFDDLARMGGPKFVYVHLIPPHPPFVFGPHGEYRDPFEFVIAEDAYTSDTYSQGYQDQVTFVSNEITKSLRDLIEGSPIPPVIVIQGDHGPWKQVGENRVSIFNAYYMPGHEDALYPEISPINSFRIVLDEYFNAEYELLPDVSYESPYSDLYQFSAIPTSCGD
jgi:hypothetical protein